MPTYTSRCLIVWCLVATDPVLPRISISIIVSFVARALSMIPGNLFCYSAISSAGVVLILPGFTVCTYPWIENLLFDRNPWQ